MLLKHNYKIIEKQLQKGIVKQNQGGWQYGGRTTINAEVVERQGSSTKSNDSRL